MRHLLLYLTFILFFVNLSAQEPELKLDNFQEVETYAPVPSADNNTHKVRKSAKWHFGITAGYQQSGIEWLKSSGSMDYNMDINTSSKPGFTIGGAASFPLDDVLSFDCGINLSLWQFGYNANTTKLSASRYVLEIPAMITFFEPDAIVPIFIQLGITGGFCLGGAAKISGEQWDEDPIATIPASYIFSKATFGLVIGAGYGPITLRYIQNVTGTMSNRFCRSWYTNTGSTLKSHDSWALNLTYTYWF